MTSPQKVFFQKQWGWMPLQCFILLIVFDINEGHVTTHTDDVKWAENSEEKICGIFCIAHKRTVFMKAVPHRTRQCRLHTNTCKEGKLICNKHYLPNGYIRFPSTLTQFFVPSISFTLYNHFTRLYYKSE